MGTSSRVVRDYLSAFTSGDMETARSLLADEFSFRGPILEADGRDAFFEGAAGLAPVVRGYRMLRQWEDGDDVCSVYEFNVETPAGAGSVLMSEWNTVRDGRLTSGRLVFDTAALREFMPSA